VNAVANAYSKRLAAQQDTNPPAARDMITRNLAELKAEIQRKTEEYQDIEREMGPRKPEDDPFPTLDGKQMTAAIRRLQRMKSNLESSDDAKSLAYRDEIESQLKRYNEVLMRRLTGGYQMWARKQDLKQLRIIANDMEDKLAKLDQRLLSNMRFRQVQPATVAFDEPTSIQNLVNGKP
jgi:hypothetical protein